MTPATFSSGRQPLQTGIRSAHLGSLFRNIWSGRELLLHLTARNLRSQYKQSLMGYAWVGVNPMLQFVVYNFVFATVLATPSEHGVPFALFLFVGLVPWNFFANTLGASTEAVVGGGNLVTVVYFPRELLVVAALLTRSVDWLAGFVILALLLAYHGQPVTWAVLWVPVLVVVFMLFTLGICLPLAALNLFMHDVRYLVGVGLMLWFFLTPILYPASRVPDRYEWAYDLNPVARFVSAFRYALLEGVSPPLPALLLAGVIALLTLQVGYYVFKRMEPAFADRI